MSWLFPYPLFCHEKLSSHLFASFFGVMPGMVLGVLGILGWGIALEASLKPKAELGKISHAWLMGVPVVAYLALFISVLNLGNGSFVISIGGILVGLGKCRRLNFKGEWDKGQSLLLIFGLGFLLREISSPLSFSDTTSISGFHAKALACEGLFTARFTKEPYWTGTHPEYPLLVPFLYSYFFTLMGSFRDDVIKVWQGISVLAVAMGAYSSLKKTTGSRWGSVLIVGACLYLMLTQTNDGSVELSVATYALILTACLLENSLFRIPVYLMALGFIKNESWIMAASLFGWAILFRKKEIRFAALGLLIWPLVSRFLPSRHEEYGKRLFSWEAWQTGILQAKVIFLGCAKIFFAWPWCYVWATLIVALCFYSRWKTSEKILALWTGGMLFVFLAVYLVSPWGPYLYANTFSRLLAQVAIPVLVASSVVLLREKTKPGFLIFMALAYLLPLANDFVRFRREMIPQNRINRDEISNGLIAKWDEKLPPTAAGAIVDSKDVPHDLFVTNYLLYPRRFYVSSPDEVAGTWRGTIPWKTVTPEEIQRYGFDFVIQNQELIWTKEK